MARRAGDLAKLLENLRLAKSHGQLLLDGFRPLVDDHDNLELGTPRRLHT